VQGDDQSEKWSTIGVHAKFGAHHSAYGVNSFHKKRRQF
jgi:hypothetical protein